MDVIALAELSADRRATLTHRSTGAIAAQPVPQPIVDLVEDVFDRGDPAVLDATERFDSVTLTPERLRVGAGEAAAGRQTLDADVREALRRCVETQFAYSRAVAPQPLVTYELAPGVLGGRKADPLDAVALYVPSGKASYPSSFATVAVPALVAGVPEIAVLLVPNPDGSVDPAILEVAAMLGLDRIYRANGVAATAAVACGTETFPKVDLIVGPGGPAVMAAQRYVQYRGTAVAQFFGPSECLVIADDSADPVIVAADLVNEAEHGPDSSAICLTDSADLAATVAAEVERQLALLPADKQSYARSATTSYGAIVVVPDLDTAVDLANEWGNEHIQVATRDPWALARRIRSASELLIGQTTPISAISYAIGVPSCLPTGQFARRFSGVSVDTFLKYTAVAAVDAAGLAAMAGTVTTLATYEGFPAHAASIERRRDRGQFA